MATDLKEIRELAKRFRPDEIEGCLTQQLETGANICLRDASSEKVINELAKAVFIRNLMDQGVSLPDALRELARRMRSIQMGSEKRE
ncbi:MAG: hypothetical protein HZA17_06110 [Nitrospirae bacterium]|nr:hypothetical protein [Nitrospirota bacterium]